MKKIVMLAAPLIFALSLIAVAEEKKDMPMGDKSGTMAPADTMPKKAKKGKKKGDAKKAAKKKKGDEKKDEMPK